MSGKKNGCIFCKIAGKELPVKFEYEDNEIAAFNDKTPQAPVHILIIPKVHIAEISDAAEKDIYLLGRMLAAAKDIAVIKKISSSGYRLVINCGRDAGQLIGHLHIHLIGGRQFGWPPG